MNKSLFICCLIALNLPRVAQGTEELTGDWTVNTAIPQGDPVGITESQMLSASLGDFITSVNVDLSISGGYNGDLYGYLEYQPANGGSAMAVLLNEVGTSSSNPFGSSGAGFNNIVLSDSGTANGDIHWATGIPTGTWQPDSASTLDGTFGGLEADGEWTLFLADMWQGGGTSTLDSWGLDITTVPDPVNTGMVMAMGAVLAVTGRTLMRRRRQMLQP